MVSSNGSNGDRGRSEKSEPATPAKSRVGRMREAVAEALAERTYKDSEVPVVKIESRMAFTGRNVAIPRRGIHDDSVSDWLQFLLASPKAQTSH